MLKRFGEPWSYGVPDGQIGDLVSQHGLDLISNLTIRDLMDRYLRPGTANAVLGQADPDGGIALARRPVTSAGFMQATDVVARLQPRGSLDAW